jgi:hypothetical protein
MRRFIDTATAFLDIPLDMRSRVLVLLAAAMILPSFFLPMWRMTLYSNQFPDGLRLDIYSYKLEGGRTPNQDDLKEINSLNHYIGMRALTPEDFAEFQWMPFVFGGTVLLALRVVVMGKMSKLIDLFVIFFYLGVFSLWSFYYKMYVYGHELDPTAAIKVQPFTPPMFGHQTMANFEVYTYPSTASWCMALVPVFLALAMWFSRRSWLAEMNRAR